MISARIVLFAAATARAARHSRPCTHRSEGRVPDIDPRMSAHRSAGTWCTTIKNTHQAWKFSPDVTVPGWPAPGGVSATCTRPQPHCAACRSCWIVSARALGRAVTWWEYRILRSRAPDRSAPHSQMPSGNCGTVLSGWSLHAGHAPGGPGCLPGFRFWPPPRRGLRSGGFFPGWSSLLCGIDEFPEFPEFREISRSSSPVPPAVPSALRSWPPAPPSAPATARSRPAVPQPCRAHRAYRARQYCITAGLQ